MLVRMRTRARTTSTIEEHAFDILTRTQITKIEHSPTARTYLIEANNPRLGIHVEIILTTEELDKITQTQAQETNK